VIPNSPHLRQSPRTVLSEEQDEGFEKQNCGAQHATYCHNDDGVGECNTDQFKRELSGRPVLQTIYHLPGFGGNTSFRGQLLYVGVIEYEWSACDYEYGSK
jgi:hypothetical protein